jgi:hypothetical protein
MGVSKNFVVKNGIEVSDDLIFADPTLDRVGIGKTNPLYKLDVSGEVGVTTLNVGQKLSISGPFEINGSLGNSGQFPVSTGSSIIWKDVPGQRNLSTITAAVNQTTFNVIYNPSSGVDLFVNGTRLSPSEYTANDGSTVILNVPCFGGENIDIVAYSVFGTSSPGITVQENSNIVGNLLGINNINFVGFNTIGVTENGIGITVYSAPVTITVSGSTLIFTVAGIGSTTLNLA